MTRTPQKAYWEKTIVPWEKGAFAEPESKTFGLTERVAQSFRGTVQARANLALKLLDDAVMPPAVLEIGCGSGRFCRQLVARPYIQHVTGIDISEEAIEVAKSKVGPNAGKMTFLASAAEDIRYGELPSFQFMVGLGLTPYLTDNEFDALMKGLNGRGFFVDYHPTGFSFLNVAHTIYRAINGHPFYYRFSKEQMIERVGRYGYKAPIVGFADGVSFICHPGQNATDADCARALSVMKSVAEVA